MYIAWVEYGNDESKLMKCESSVIDNKPTGKIVSILIVLNH